MKKGIASGIPSIWILEDTDTVTAGTTRRGIQDDYGNPYSGFSICHYTGDKINNVTKCRRQLACCMSTDVTRIFIPRQTHSVNVHTVTHENIKDIFPENCDALVTRIPGIIIGVNTADCVPILLYDKDNKIIGAAHAGWRGALNGIIENTVTAMLSIGASKSSLHAIICPSIGIECFEVGEEVAQLFPSVYVTYLYGPRPHIDLRGYVRSRLIDAGIPKDTIILTEICTRCMHYSYFSARKLGIASGRNFSFIRLNENLSDVCDGYS